MFMRPGVDEGNMKRYDIHQCTGCDFEFTLLAEMLFNIVVMEIFKSL